MDKIPIKIKVILWIWFIQFILKNHKKITKSLLLASEAPFSQLAVHHIIDEIIKNGPPKTQEKE